MNWLFAPAENLPLKLKCRLHRRDKREENGAGTAIVPTHAGLAQGRAVPAGPLAACTGWTVNLQMFGSIPAPPRDYDALTQLVERQIFNLDVQGSRP